MRGVDVLLAPERVLFPDPIGARVLGACDGERSVAELCAELAEAFEGPADRIVRDVIALLQDLSDRGYVDP